MTEPKKRGRPPKVAGQRRTSHTFRLAGNVRSVIIEAAAANGRSLSEEIEWRIEQSVNQPALIDALAERLEARAAKSRRNAISRAEYDALPDVFRRHLAAPDEIGM